MRNGFRPYNKYEEAYLRFKERQQKRQLSGESFFDRFVYALFGRRNQGHQNHHAPRPHSGNRVRHQHLYHQNQAPVTVQARELPSITPKQEIRREHRVIQPNTAKPNTRQLKYNQQTNNPGTSTTPKSVYQPRINDEKPVRDRKSENQEITSEKPSTPNMPRSSQKKPLRSRKTKAPSQKQKSKKKKKFSLFSKSFFLRTFLVFGILALLVLGAFTVWFISLNIPDVGIFDDRKISNSTKIYDRTGEILLYDIHENIRRTVVPLEEINPYAQDAIIAIEDHTFYEHNGIVVRSTIRAIIQTVMSRLGLSSAGTAGGSTLTQQVIKNTLLTSERTVTRKVKEWVLAVKLERSRTKEEILEIYLNEAPYGGTIYGIEEASRVFFGVPASDITLAQSAYLAAIPNRPTYYNPHGPNRRQLDQRQQTVLGEMRRYGFITDAEYRSALEEEVEFLSQEDNGVKALHFVQYVRAYLEEQYGQDVVEHGGLRVITTLDYELQQKAEEILKQHIEEVEDSYDASNAALVALEAETGQIITMVGSRDYFDPDIDGNFNVTIAQRQPGSSFKPIAYAQAFEEGYLPETAVFDARTQFNVRCLPTNLTSGGDCYSPNNHDGDFQGAMTLRDALAQSRNIPAVKVTYLAGVSDVIRRARSLGIESLNQSPEYYGLGLVLGGGEVTLLEMTNAYATFAQEGVYNPSVSILSVEDSEGNLLEEFQENPTRSLSANSSNMVSSILADNVARTPLFGSQSFLNFGNQDVAGKTGTTNDNRDAWLVGYTPRLAVGVWTGNNDNTPMRRGSSISGNPWRQYMNEALPKYPGGSFGDYTLPEDFNTLPPMVRGQWEGTQTITQFVQNRENEDSSQETGETPEDTTSGDFGGDTQTLLYFDPNSILHGIDKNNPGVALVGPSQDPQYDNWEYGVDAYVQGNLQDLIIQNEERVEQELENQEESEDEGFEDFVIEIKGVDEGEEFEADDSFRVSTAFDGISTSDIEKVDFFVNGEFLESDDHQPFSMRIHLDEIEDFLYYENTVLVRAYTEDGQQVSSRVDFLVEDYEDRERPESEELGQIIEEPVFTDSEDDKEDSEDDNSESITFTESEPSDSDEE